MIATSDAADDPLGLVAFAKEIKALDLKQPTLQYAIDGIMYTSTKLPAGPAGKLLPVVTRVMMPMLRAGTGVDAVEALASALIDDDWIELAKRLFDRLDCGCLTSTQKPGRVLSDFDEHFAGEFPHLGRVFLFVAQHNFLGFSRGAR